MNRTEQAPDITEIHRMADMLFNLDVGLVVIDRDYRVRFWNTFMNNHSGLRPQKALGMNLLEIFPELATGWFQHKVESVFLLNHRAFTHWEQRPYLFRFNNHRTLTGSAEYMYQNTIMIPLIGLHGVVDHVAIMVYDATDTAVSEAALTAANAELAALSRTDQLTGLNNRAYWEECVVNEFNRFRRSGQKTTLVMFDIDHFKKVNDSYGHLAGDAVIRATAVMLTKTKRETDIAGRYGGEEFGVVLINTDAPAATHFAERLRKKIEANPVVFESNTIQYTISLGIAQLAPDTKGHKQWMAHADHALYQSKEGGRNRYTLFEPTGA